MSKDNGLVGMMVSREIDHARNNLHYHRGYDSTEICELLRGYIALLEICAASGSWIQISHALSIAMDQSSDSSMTYRAELAANEIKEKRTLAAQCPFCGALPGFKCIIGNSFKNAGKELSDFHVDRFRNAENIQYSNPII